MGVPLIKEGRLAGALCVTDARARHWLEGDVDILRDVAERIWASIVRARAEAALKAAHDTFRHLVDRSPFGIYAVDAEFRLVQVSEGAQKVFENVRPLIGRDFAEVLRILWPEPFATEAIGRFRRTLATGEPYHSPRTVESRADIAATEAYDWKIERLTLPDGRLGVVCHFYDLTERQRYEDALRESEQRFRTLADSAPVLIWVNDEDGCVMVNRAYRQYLGVAADTDVRGYNWAQFVHPDDEESYVGGYLDAYAQGTQFEAEFRFRRRDGEHRWMKSIGVPRRGSDGAMLGYVGATVDIDDVKRAEEALRESEQQRAMALERALQAERETALTLQRSLLPRELPAVLGGAVAVRYRTASPHAEVGGDCYDVFDLPGGQLGVVIGDVAGKGIPAAAVMGRIRAALRAYAMDGYEPSEILERLNRTADPDDMATLIVLMFDPATGRVVYANAGHPPPIIRHADGRTTFLEEGRSAPIGSNPQKRYRESEVTLQEGDTLVLYTDGLVEEKEASIDEGLGDLARLVGAQAGDVEALVEGVLEARLGDRVAIDDVAILALRAMPLDPRRITLKIAATPDAVPALRHTLQRWLRAAGAEGEALFALLVAAGEAASNAVEHAYGAHDATIEVAGEREGDVVTVTIRDAGRWRAPRGEHRGRGQPLMRSLVDDVQITSQAGGTTVQLRHSLNRSVES